MTNRMIASLFGIREDPLFDDILSDDDIFAIAKFHWDDIRPELQSLIMNFIRSSARETYRVIDRQRAYNMSRSAA